MTDEEILNLIDTEIAKMPALVQSRLKNFPVVIRDREETGSSDLGRCQKFSRENGIIFLYITSIEMWCEAAKEDFQTQLFRILKHEIGHAVGMNHEYLEKIGRL